jgi:hypothetical protein
MEPVPEAKRMEEFRSSPLPSLRLQSISTLNVSEFDSARKPPNLRRATDPSPSSPSSPSWSPSTLPFRTRNASSLSTHVRSRSAASLAPPMARTQSLPGVNGAGHILYSPQFRSSSPSVSPNRARAPRMQADESFPTSPTRMSVHNPERRLSERSSAPNLGLGAGPGIQSARLRRPASPLRTLAQLGTAPLPDVPETVPEHVHETIPEASNEGAYEVPSSVASSPSYRPYDPLSSGYSYGSAYLSSSVPSTPTSARSRSPSISSLETIPDSPDAEEAALEAERIAQLKAAADAADGGGEGKGRSGLDVPARGRTLGFGSRDKRKRWSVCGAERRGDLDLETIWED